jgi:hypothetical protein
VAIVPPALVLPDGPCAGAGALLLPDQTGFDIVHRGQPDMRVLPGVPAWARALAPAAVYARPADAAA